MKFKLHWLEYEIEGHEDTVRSQFADFKNFLWDLLPKVNIIDVPRLNNPQDWNEIPASEKEQSDTSDYPNIKEVVRLDLPQSEPDWILAYAFYSSSFGSNNFTLEDIKEKYKETGRKTEGRFKHFSENITSLIRKWYIKMHNDDEYLLKQEGITYAQEILRGNTTKNKKIIPVTAKTKTSIAKRKTSWNWPKQLPNLDLRPVGKESLKDFYQKYQEYGIKSSFEKNVLYVYYLENVLWITAITMDHIFTCYKETEQKIPLLYQSLIDTKNAKGWIDLSDMGAIKTTRKWTNYIEFDIKEKWSK